jgi:hypothetical protein
MKSERRHELQTNALADWVGHQIDAVKPHAGLILTLIVAIIAVLVTWMYFLQSGASSSTEAWSDFLSAADESDPVKLGEMAQRHAGEPASLWAVLLAADVHLAQGAQQAFTDRAAAEKSLAQAVKSYETVLNELREPVLRRRALFGLAEANEALFGVTGDKQHLEAALANYGQVEKEWPESALGRSAKQKKESLETKSAQEFLVWFSNQTPEPPPTPSSSSGGLGALPGATGGLDLSKLPSAGDLTLPEEPAQPATEPNPPAGESSQPAPEATPPETEPSQASPEAKEPADANSSPDESGPPLEGAAKPDSAEGTEPTPANDSDSQEAAPAGDASEDAPR